MGSISCYKDHAVRTKILVEVVFFCCSITTSNQEMIFILRQSDLITEDNLLSGRA